MNIPTWYVQIVKKYAVYGVGTAALLVSLLNYLNVWSPIISWRIESSIAWAFAGLFALTLAYMVKVNYNE